MQGKLQGIIDRESASQENIMTLATGGEINEHTKDKLEKMPMSMVR